MREILFRGKRIDNGKWVDGELLHDMQDRPHIYWKTPKELPIVFSNHAIVRPETVGQFTGLTDNNGIKIFEGDIVEGADFTAEDGGYGVVSFVDGAFEVNGNNVVGTFHENYWGKEFEVIGNIHDNPELLRSE